MGGRAAAEMASLTCTTSMQGMGTRCRVMGAGRIGGPRGALGQRGPMVPFGSSRPSKAPSNSRRAVSMACFLQ